MTTLQQAQNMKDEARKLSMLPGMVGEAAYAAYLKLVILCTHAAAVEIGQEKV